MSELSTSAFVRLRRTAATRLRETMADTLQVTIDDLESKRQDAIAQDIIDQIVVIAQGRDPAASRLQDLVNFVLDLTDDEDEEEDSSVTGVETAPKTKDDKQG
jgi:hypothetical protein